MSSTLRWFKSSYSNDSGGQCLEVAYTWRKSSYSNDSGGNCVEVAACACDHATTSTSTVHVRDSKDTGLTHLTLSATTWATFLDWAG
ncbi:DUF397 domain-containing protein [Streptomyces sp. NPDC058247]|uniref:DUF397 domain-containing protein n=1 Tax=Streptomyces sp. NPDC058247 TaxID=3346401 RepID=UPI0036E71DDA